MNKDEKFFLKEMIRTYYEPEMKKMKELKEYLEYQLSQLDFEKDTKAKMLCAMALTILESKGE